MSAVREFLFSLMIVSACCGIVGFLTPEGSTVSKYVQFLLAIIVTVLLLSPVGSVIGVIPELLETARDITVSLDSELTYDYNDPLIAKAVEEISEQLKAQLNDKFKIEPIGVRVYCDSSDVESIEINRIEIEYPAENSLLFSDSVKYIKSVMGQDCEVVCRCEDIK